MLRVTSPPAGPPGAGADGLFDFRAAGSFAARYMETFYDRQPPTEDERAVLRFLHRHVDRLSGQPAMLEVGCGPTVHHILPFVPHVSSIEMADYLDENLAEVWRWQQQSPDAYDWRHYSRFVAQLGNRRATSRTVAALEAAARSKIRALSPCDLKQPAILGRPRTYPVVAAFYCTEEVGIALPRWEEVMANLCRTVAPGGHLFLSCLRDTDFYLVGEARYPCARITEADLQRVLPTLGFDMDTAVIEGVPLETQHDTGLEGVVLVTAQRRLS